MGKERGGGGGMKWEKRGGGGHEMEYRCCACCVGRQLSLSRSLSQLNKNYRLFPLLVVRELLFPKHAKPMLTKCQCKTGLASLSLRFVLTTKKCTVALQTVAYVRFGGCCTCILARISRSHSVCHLLSCVASVTYRLT